MPACLRWSLLLVLSTLACSGQRTSAVRDGPAFGSVYPSIEQLLAVEDPEGARHELAELQLPDTQEHHDALLAAAREAEALDVGQLLLLLESVSFADTVTGLSTTIVNGTTTRVTRTHQRGQGRWAPVADSLLREGLPRLGELSLREVGRLLAHSESDEVLAELWVAYGAPLDDGGVGSIQTLGDAMEGGDALLALFSEVLLPSGGLAGERADAALLALAYDSERLVLARRLVQTREALELDTLLRWSGRLTYDSSRLDLLDGAAERLGDLDGAQLGRLLDQLTYDSSRQVLMQTLLASGAVRMRPAELPERLRTFTYDSTRATILAAVLPTLDERIPVDVARQLLEALTYDSTRLEALKDLAPRLAPSSRDQRAALLDVLVYDSSRDQAGELLDLDGEPDEPR